MTTKSFTSITHALKKMYNVFFPQLGSVLLHTYCNNSKSHLLICSKNHKYYLYSFKNKLNTVKVSNTVDDIINLFEKNDSDYLNND